jgi:hypothetical protein
MFKIIVSFYRKLKGSFLDCYWSFDRRLLDFGSGVYFLVYFFVAVIVFLDIVTYVILPVLFFLLSCLYEVFSFTGVLSPGGIFFVFGNLPPWGVFLEVCV